MPNEFIIKNGFRSQGNSEVTGSLSISGSISTASPINLTGFATGSVLFTSGSAGVVTQSSFLNWDNSSNVLKFGTTSNNTSRILFQWPVLSTFPLQNGIHWGDSAASSYGFIALDRGGGEFRWHAASSYFPTIYSSGAEAMRIPTTRNVLIGTTTDAGFKLDVNGTARVSGAMTIGSSIITGNFGNLTLSNNGVAGVSLTFTNSEWGSPNPAIFGTVGLHAHASSQVEIKSTTRGFLPPRMTLAQRTAISSPAVGLIVYETGSTTTEGIWVNETTGWQQLLTNTGTQSISGSLSITSSAGTGSAIYAYKSGSTVLDIQGSQGQLFSVVDALSGSLMSVNDVSGLPILEVFSDDRVVMGTYGAPGLTVSGSTIIATGSLLGTSSYATTTLSASYAATASLLLGSVQSASYAATASYVETAQTASYVLNAQTASYVETAQTASYVQNAQTASYVLNAVSASFASTASFINPLNQSVVLTGSLRGQVSALSIASNTASIDLSTNNFFILNLVNGANTHINPTNINPGQTVNIRVNQGSAGTGTVSFASIVDQASGSAYTASTVANAIDIVTMITFDSSLVFVSSIKNMI